MFQALIGPMVGIVRDVLRRTLPEKMDEKTRAEIEARVLSELLQADLSGLEKQAQIILAEAQGKSWLQRNWRPILMLVIVAIVANNYLLVPWLSLFTNKVAVLALPEKLWNLMTLGVGGYIAGRSAEKIVSTWKRAS